MRYADRDGNIYEEENGQDRLLHWMYTTMAGRASLKILIRPWVSKLGGAFLSSPISKCLIKGFVKNNHIDMSEYEKKNYKSYNEFFSRKIKEGKRLFPEDKTILGSPCDCKVSVYPIEEKTSFVVKDTRYTLDSLIRNRKIARHFQGGYAVILRLTVDDYHRYCYFDDGIKSENHRIDGVYHTVNPIANDHVKIYKENTREYTLMKTKHFGDALQMEVGALMVGKIVNHDGAGSMRRGIEKGYFQFGGSTIILLLENLQVCCLLCGGTEPRYVCFQHHRSHQEDRGSAGKARLIRKNAMKKELYSRGGTAPFRMYSIRQKPGLLFLSGFGRPPDLPDTDLRRGHLG